MKIKKHQNSLGDFLLNFYTKKKKLKLDYFYSIETSPNVIVRKIYYFIQENIKNLLLFQKIVLNCNPIQICCFLKKNKWINSQISAKKQTNLFYKNYCFKINLLDLIFQFNTDFSCKSKFYRIDYAEKLIYKNYILLFDKTKVITFYDKIKKKLSTKQKNFFYQIKNESCRVFFFKIIVFPFNFNKKIHKNILKLTHKMLKKNKRLFIFIILFFFNSLYNILLLKKITHKMLKKNKKPYRKNHISLDNIYFLNYRYKKKNFFCVLKNFTHITWKTRLEKILKELRKDNILMFIIKFKIKVNLFFVQINKQKIKNKIKRNTNKKSINFRFSFELLFFINYQIYKLILNIFQICTQKKKYACLFYRFIAPNVILNNMVQFYANIYFMKSIYFY